MTVRPEERKPPRARPAVSLELSDGSLVEMVHDPAEGPTRFCVGTADGWRFESEVLVQGERRVPYSATNNLLHHGVVLLPAAPEEYPSDVHLIEDIRAFIHRYVDVSTVYESLALYYVLLTWLYDRFNELPYLRVRGDAGSGKTRFLQVVGSLCYKPIFASGASTVSPLFRILDAFRGTLIIGESDFRVSDERAEVIKILNNGNARGFPVLRSEQVGNRREFDPRAYAVFGPKIVATRGFFQDHALESRCITEEMGQGRLRTDIPITLPATWSEEARRLRNQLLLFRFRHWHRRWETESLVDATIEPRLNQILTPLLAVVDDEAVRTDLRTFGRRLQKQAVADRGLDMEARVLEIIRDLSETEDGNQLGVKEITQWFADRFGEEYGTRVTTKWIGGIIRRKLLIRTQKSHGVFVIPPQERGKLQPLYEKYGIAAANNENGESVSDAPAS